MNVLVCLFQATILEGKYWKRRAEAVTAEYKKWRMYYRNRALGWGNKDVPDVVSITELYITNLILILNILYFTFP